MRQKKEIKCMIFFNKMTIEINEIFFFWNDEVFSTLFDAVCKRLTNTHEFLQLKRAESQNAKHALRLSGISTLRLLADASAELASPKTFTQLEAEARFSQGNRILFNIKMPFLTCYTANMSSSHLKPESGLSRSR